MFERLEILEHAKHQDLRLGKANTFDFARNISAVKLVASELRIAARYYPIVMLEEAPGVPQAVLSIEPGNNTCINDDGMWTIPYVPAFIRLYPFTLARIPDQEDKFALCIDPDAPHFKTGTGEPIYTANGEISETINDKILSALKAYQGELEQTVSAFKDLDKKNLIVHNALTYRVNQEEKRIDGFKSVDMDKLARLEDNELARMVRNGTMAMVLEHVHSLNNFSRIAAQAKALPV